MPRPNCFYLSHPEKLKGNTVLYMFELFPDVLLTSALILLLFGTGPLFGISAALPALCPRWHSFLRQVCRLLSDCSPGEEEALLASEQARFDEASGQIEKSTV